MSRKRRFQAWNLDRAMRSWAQNCSIVKPLACLAANAIAPKCVELRVGAPCHRVDSWNGTKWSASQATRPGKDGYLGRLRYARGQGPFAERL